MVASNSHPKEVIHSASARVYAYRDSRPSLSAGVAFAMWITGAPASDEQSRILGQTFVSMRHVPDRQHAQTRLVQP
jgi:hypothetical protein